MTLRPTLRRVTASLVCGLILTIVAAWLAAAFSDVGPGTLHTLKAGQTVPASFNIPSDWTLRTWQECPGPALQYDLVSECEWMGSKLGFSPATAPNRIALRITTGYPLPSMRWSPMDDSLPPKSAIRRVYKGITLPGKGRIGQVVDRHLPLIPVPTPFLIDLCVWSVLSFGAISVVAARRARSRRRRGLCVQCAYPVTGLAACPECGTPTQPAPAQT